MDPGQRLRRFRDDGHSRTSSSRKFRGVAEGIVRDPCIYATMPARMRGLTLLEVLIVIVILGILAAIAIPSLLTFMQLNKVNAVSRELVSALVYAKSEAIKRGDSVSICPRDVNNTSGCGTDWAAGWVVFKGTALSSSNDRLSINDRDMSTEMTLDVTAPSITFDSSGFTGSTTTFTLWPADCRSGNRRSVTLSATGRVSVSELACLP